MVNVTRTRTSRQNAELECQRLVKRAEEISGDSLNFLNFGAEILEDGRVYMSAAPIAHVQAFSVADARVLLEEEIRKLTVKLQAL